MSVKKKRNKSMFEGPYNYPWFGKKLQMYTSLVNERGYFRSPRRGVKNGKIEFPFLSIGRTPMRRCASESSMSQLYQVIFSIQKDGYRLVYSNLKLKSYLKTGPFRPLKSPSSVYHFRKSNKISFFTLKIVQMCHVIILML